MFILKFFSFSIFLFYNFQYSIMGCGTSAQVGSSNADLATKKKEEGNNLFNSNQFLPAIDKYTEALSLNPLPVYYCNRSACYAKLQRWHEAEKDGEKSILLDRNFVKGYFRQAIALQHIGKIDDAIKIAKQGLILDPNNDDIKLSMKELGVGSSQPVIAQPVQNISQPVMMQQQQPMVMQQQQPMMMGQQPMMMQQQPMMMQQQPMMMQQQPMMMGQQPMMMMQQQPMMVQQQPMMMQQQPMMMQPGMAMGTMGYANNQQYGNRGNNDNNLALGLAGGMIGGMMLGSMLDGGDGFF